MEIREYLRIARRRLAILLLVPLLTAGVVAVWTFAQPRTYTAKATIAAPSVVGGSSSNQYSGADGTKSFVANFDAALTSQPILMKVSAATHVPTSTLASGLSASQIGTSTLMTVTYNTTSKKTADPVVRAAASQTIQFLFATQVELAQRNLAEAQKSVDSAQAQLTQFYQQTGLVLPDQQFQVKAQQIASLQQQQLQSQASGNTAAAAGLSAAIAGKQQALAALSKQVITYHSLFDRKTQAETNWSTIQQSLAQVKAQYDAVNPSDVVTVAQPVAQSRAPMLLKKVAPALVGSVFLAVLLVFLLEVLSRPHPVGRVQDGSALDEAGLVNGNGSRLYDPKPAALHPRTSARRER